MPPVKKKELINHYRFDSCPDYMVSLFSYTIENTLKMRERKLKLSQEYVSYSPTLALKQKIMYKKANIVLLLANPNNETSNGIFLKDRNWYHLYITTNEEIKEGDWWIDLLENRIFQVTTEDVIVTQSDNFNHSNFKKIIATTDKSLTINSIYGIDSFDSGMFGGKSEKIKLPSLFNLPQIPQSFIEYFVSEYNKGNIITEVMVKYESNLEQLGSENDEYYEKLKTNPDNTINIKKIKDSWSTEEVKNLCFQAFIHHKSFDGKVNINDALALFDPFKEWIKQHI